MGVLDASFLKLDRAGVHIDSLARSLHEKDVGDSYFFEPLAGAAKPSLVLRHLKPDLSLGLLIGETVYQLRSSLDLAMIDLSLANDPGCDLDQTQWPTGDTAEKRKNRVPGLTPAQLNYIENVARPYAGGDALLHWLNGARNVDVHYQILPSKPVAECSNLIRLGPGFNPEIVLGGTLAGLLAHAAAASNVDISTDGLAFEVSSLPMPLPELARIASQQVMIPLRLSFDHPNKAKKVIIGSDPVLPKLRAVRERVRTVLQDLAAL